MSTEMIDEMIKTTMDAMLDDVAESASCDRDHLNDLLIEMMQETGYLQYDVQRVMH